MKISIWSFFVLIVMVALAGCKKNEENETPVIQEESGSIFVTVVAEGQLVANAAIRTEPATSEVTTDATGTAHIENVTGGVYQVIARNDEIGTGSSALAVDPGEVNNVSVQLIPGVFTGPMVNIFSLAPQTAGIGDTVRVKAAVADLVDEDEDLNFVWSTDLDGVISTVGVGEEGYATLEHVFETLGDRILTVTVTNSEGESNTAQVPIDIVEIPDPVVLNPIELGGLSAQLNWTPTDAENFAAYGVYRQSESGFEQIAFINEINTTSYADSEIDIDSEYSYKIGIQLNNNAPIIYSNIETWQYEGSYVDVGTGLDMLKHHPNNPIIYGLDTDNNLLVIINTELEEVVNSFYVGSTPTDMDFSLDNQLLYIANFGSNEITVVDLVSQSVASSFYVDVESSSWDGLPHTLAVLANDILAFSSSDPSNRVQLVDIITGENIYTSAELFDGPYLTANSDGTMLFVGESESGWSKLHRFTVTDNELFLLETSDDLGDPEPQVFITDNDEFVFYAGRKILVNNITSTLGSFDTEIYAINADGSRVLSEQHVFDGNSYTPIEQLPIPTEVSVFGNDNSTAWLFHEASDRLYKVTIE